MPRISESLHNKSLVIGSSVTRDSEGNLMANFLSELIKKNNSSKQTDEAIMIKNSLENSSSSYLNLNNMRQSETGNLGSPRGGKSSDSFQPSYLKVQSSIITSKPDGLINSFDKDGNSHFNLKLPDVGLPPTLPPVQTSK